MTTRIGFITVCFIMVVLVWNCRAEPDALVHICGAVYKDGKPDEGMSDLMMVNLSERSGIAVVTRNDMSLILDEIALSKFAGDSRMQAGLGRLFGVDYFVWINDTPNYRATDVVDGRTGRIRTVLLEEGIEKKSLAEAIPSLVDSVAKSLLKTAKSTESHLPSVSIILNRVKEAKSIDAELFAARLRQGLLAKDVVLLCRSFADDLVDERWCQEKGLLQDRSGDKAFMGTDYIVPIVINPKHIGVSVLQTRTGQKMGATELLLNPTTLDKLSHTAVNWIIERVKKGGKPLIKPRTAKRSLMPEILECFYKGILLHNEGRYLNAAEAFNRAAGTAGGLHEEREWSRSSFRLAGWPEIDKAIATDPTWGQYRARKAKRLTTHMKSGVAFIGVTTPADTSPVLSTQLGMLIVDGLHKATRSKVFTVSGLAHLRDEYDLLLGLDNTKGTTWDTAPAMMLNQLVTAHCRVKGDGYALSMCLVTNALPVGIHAVQVDLSQSREAWERAIFDGLSVLLSRDPPSPSWDVPLILDESETELVKRLNKKYSDWDYLRLLSRNPDHLEFLLQASPHGPVSHGMVNWLLRNLPDVPARPWFEMATITHPLGETIERYQALSVKYPDHLAGLFAKYNTLLMTVTIKTLTETQKDISRIIARSEQELEPYKSSHDGKWFVRTIDTMREIESSMRLALGQAGGKSTNLLRNGGTVHVPWGRVFPDIASPTTLPLLRDKLVEPNSAEKMLIDWSVYVVMRDNDRISANFMKKLTESFKDRQDLVQYLFLKYGPAFVILRRGDKHDAVFEEMFLKYTDVLITFFNSKAVPLRAYHSTCLLEGTRNIAWRFKNPSLPYVEATRQVQKAALRAFLDKRLLPAKSSSGVGMFLSSIEAWKNVEAREAIMLNIAKSWVGPVSSDRDALWGNQTEWLCNNATKQEQAKFFGKYVDKLRAKYRDKPKDRGVVYLYGQFVIVFLRAGEYDTAEKLIREILGWKKDEANKKHVDGIRPMCLFLLANLEHRNGNVPSAFRLAKQSLPSCRGGLLSFSSATNRSQYGSIKAMTVDLINRLRKDPNAPFRNPYGNPKGNGRRR